MDNQAIVNNLVASLKELALDSLSPQELDRFEEITGVLLSRYDPKEQERLRSGPNVVNPSGAALSGLANADPGTQEDPPRFESLYSKMKRNGQI